MTFDGYDIAIIVLLLAHPPLWAVAAYLTWRRKHPRETWKPGPWG